jgi:hypothetical protein
MSDEGGGKQTFHSIESMKDLVMQWKGTWTIILVDKELAHVQQKRRSYFSASFQTSKYVSQNSINILLVINHHSTLDLHWNI